MLAIWRVIYQDEKIRELLGLTGLPVNEIAKRIIRTSSYEGLLDNTKPPLVRLCVYFRPSRRGRIPIVSEQVVQVDCHVPADDHYIAWDVLERVNELLNGQQIGRQILHYDGFLGELPTAPKFYCAGMRFTFQNVV